MERDDVEGQGVRSSEEVAAELTEVEGEYESLRATTPGKRLAHVLLSLLLTVMATAVSVPLVVRVLDFVGVAEGPAALVTLSSALVMFLLYGGFFSRNLFIPKEPTLVPDQQRLYQQRLALRQELQRTLEHEEDASRALADAQRAMHGGNLSIAAPSRGGGLEVTAAVDGGLSRPDEVVLGLSAEGEDADSCSHVVREEAPHQT